MRIPKARPRVWGALISAVVLAVVLLTLRLHSDVQPTQSLAISDLAARVKSGEIASIVASDNGSLIQTVSGQRFTVTTGGASPPLDRSDAAGGPEAVRERRLAVRR